MNENVCNDNRFNLIAKYKAKLIEATNIETSQDEMAVIDNILFRIWQMGWLDKLDAASPWHMVEDDYPDLLQFVVVCNDDGKCVVAQYVGYQTDSLTPWRIAYTMYDTDAYYEMENGPVRYWMPIEPPKEE